MIPRGAGTVETEVELAVVIGTIAKNVPASLWQRFVLGFTIGNDVTSRTWQSGDGQWARAKGADTWCPLGPVIETELDLADTHLASTISGEVAQSGTTADLIFDIGTLVEAASSAFTLLPGDVILTGTPAGTRPVTPGDTVALTIDGIGSLENPVVAEPARAAS